MQYLRRLRIYTVELLTMRTKQLLTVMALLCATVSQVNAKVFGEWDSENRHSLSLGVGFYPFIGGYFTSQKSALDLNEIADNTPNYYDYDQSEVRESPIFSLNYFYRFSRLFSAGCTFGYGHEATDLVYDDSDKYAFTTHDNVFLFTPTVRLHWLNTKYVEMYSGLGVIGYGVALSTNANRTEGKRVVTEGMSTQFTPVALSVKLDRTYIFSEVGIGTLGIFRLGVGHRF